MEIDEDDSQISPLKGGLLELLSTVAPWIFRGSYPSMKQGSRVDSGATDIELSLIKQEDETPEEPLQVGETI
jgi:hypothetical protein